jgi:asparagine synthetase B (glutamine-hydrolysing)
MASARMSASRMARLSQALRMQVMYHPDFRLLKAAAKGVQGFLKASSPQGRINRSWRLVGEDDVLPAEWGDTNRMLYRKFHSTVLPTILRNFERVSMAHGVEVRMPFMDWRLVTYVMSLPDSSKVGGGLAKRVAREALKGSIPEEIRNTRVKIGFTAPLPQWLNGPLQPWVVDLCGKARARHVNVPFSVEGLGRQYMTRQKAQAFDWRTACEMWPRLNLLHFSSRLGRENTTGTLL